MVQNAASAKSKLCKKGNQHGYFEKSVNRCPAYRCGYKKASFSNKFLKNLHL